MNSNTHHPDDEAFNRKLHDLYNEALFDEEFQLQIVEDLRALPIEGQKMLKEADQVFINDAVISDELAKKLMAITCGCKPKPWWKKLFSFNFDMGNFLVPAFSVPVSLMAGILLGVFLPPILNQLNGQSVFLGGDTPTTVHDATLGEITEDTKREPKKWLAAIADLVQQGKTSEAQAQLQEFEMRHPGYSASD